MKPLGSMTSTPGRIAAVSVVAATLAVAATVTAANAVGGPPDPKGAAAPVAAPRVPKATHGGPATPHGPAEPAATPVGDEWYTQERWEAFFGAGYYMEDAEALAELWGVDLTEAKGRAGQLILDGQPVPVAPGSSIDPNDPNIIVGNQLRAFWDAGYTYEDADALAELWNVDVSEVKTTAGQQLLDGQTLPIPPSGTPGHD